MAVSAIILGSVAVSPLAVSAEDGGMLLHPVAEELCICR